jgi:outer membrane immunogenic protein
MKKIAVPAAAALLTLGVATANAADLPSLKAPPPAPPPPPAWTGFYIGANAGYSWSSDGAITQSYADTLPGGFATFAALGQIPSRLSIRDHGFLGGGQVGFNWQFDNRFLLGLEADIQGLAGGDGSTNFIAGASASNFSRGLGNIGTVRARLGFVLAPEWLVYGTGGLAYGQGSATGNYYGAWSSPLVAVDTESQSLTGFAAGGGVEWLFRPNWSVKAEYLYYDLGTLTTSGVQFAYKSGGVAAISTAQSNARFSGNIVRVGINYHVNWSGPPKLFGSN